MSANENVTPRALAVDLSYWSARYDEATALMCDHGDPYTGQDPCERDACYQAMNERAYEMLDAVWPLVKKEIKQLRDDVSVWAEQATANEMRRRTDVAAVLLRVAELEATIRALDGEKTDV